MRHQAIYNTHSNVVSINANGDCLDIIGNQISVNEQLVQLEITKLTAEYESNLYKNLRAREYPPVTDYLDAVVKGDQAQIDKYIQDCLAVKAKYPKPE